MIQVYVGIGSNIEPEKQIRSGLCALQQQFGRLTISTIYANAAIGFTGPDFHNGVVGFSTDFSVYAVASGLRDIEAAHRHFDDPRQCGSRALDLDLLLYGNHVVNEVGLCLPRAEITRYAFVLKPLAEIAGDRRHPLLDVTFAELWAAFDQQREKLTPVSLADLFRT